MDTDTLTATPDATFAPCEPSHFDADRSTASVDEQEVIVKYLYLVDKAVARIKRNVPSHIRADDLHSTGVLGLMAAARKFNPESEATFPSFASIRIRGAILDELRRTDTCPRRTRIRARKLAETVNAVEQKLGRPATPGEISSSLGVTREEYFKLVDSARPIRIVTLDREVEEGEGADSTLHNLLADENDETGGERMEKAELQEMLAQHIAELPEVPRKILAMYYFENMRFSTIAESFDLTESRISQIHRATIQDLREWIKTAREK